jgi:hypothetical protein
MHQNNAHLDLQLRALRLSRPGNTRTIRRRPKKAKGAGTQRPRVLIVGEMLSERRERRTDPRTSGRNFSWAATILLMIGTRKAAMG